MFDPVAERQKKQQSVDRMRAAGLHVKSPKKKKKAAHKPAIQPAKPAFVFDPKVTYPYRPGMGAEFYSTAEWRKIRFTVLRESGAVCCVCGQSRASGHVMHVDHIKPRSKFPALELVRSNLQVLCSDCNWGKGSRVI
jgi:hypothetical protein